jgi:hypothetical protein
VARAHRFVTECGFAVVAIDAPNHGDRPKTEEFARVAAEFRAGVLAGEDVAARLGALHTFLADQAVAEWQAVLTAVQELDVVGVGSVDKTLHANPGEHGEIPEFETGDSLRFFRRHLG